MQVVRIYRKSGGLVQSFRPFFQSEETMQDKFPEGPFLWLR